MRNSSFRLDSLKVTEYITNTNDYNTQESSRGHPLCFQNLQQVSHRCYNISNSSSSTCLFLCFKPHWKVVQKRAAQFSSRNVQFSNDFQMRPISVLTLVLKYTYIRSHRSRGYLLVLFTHCFIFLSKNAIWYVHPNEKSYKYKSFFHS